MRQTCLLQARNAFEILSRLPKHGLGSKLSRTSWGDDSYWTITKVRLSPDGKHGAAWGVLTWRGQPQQLEAPTKLNGPLKPAWRQLAEGEQQPWQSLVAAALQQEQAEAAAAAEPQAAAAAEQTAAA